MKHSEVQDNMSINPKVELQDVEAWINIVEKEKVKGKLYL